jgi:hypothetical protein
MTPNVTVKHAKDDADTLIVQTALDLASQQIPVTVVADDTDVLVLLVHHFKSFMADIFMLSEMTRVRTARRAITPIRAVCESIGDTAVRQLLVAHAISGCDTTSALFGQGKSSVFHKIVKNKDTLPYTDVLGSPSASRHDVIEAGLKLLTLLYGGKPEDTLNKLRYATYMNQVATRKSHPNPERLPPMENSAQFHVLRVHLQVVQWLSLMEVQLDPEDWGWKNEGSLLVPIASDQKSAPDDILNVISCKCKMGKKAPCSSPSCSCRKHGLKCVAACKHCCGKVCSNPLADVNTAAGCTFDNQDSETEEEAFQIVIDDCVLTEGIDCYEEIVEMDVSQ